MKIRYASDLHIDYNTDLTYKDVVKKLNLDNIDLLILSGDTAEYPTNLRFCSHVSNLYPNLKIIEVAGNHLYYSCSKYFMPMSMVDKMCEAYSLENPNYTFLNNKSIIDTENNVKFIGSTMWTKLGEQFGYQMRIQTSLNDFRYILNDNFSTITPLDIIKQHDKSIKYITKEINNCEVDHCIVITHHAPFFDYYSDISHAFGIDLNSKLCRLKKFPDYWVYGHTHINKDINLSYKRGNIRCVTNQMGYKGESQWNITFDAWSTYSPDKIIEI